MSVITATREETITSVLETAFGAVNVSVKQVTDILDNTPKEDIFLSVRDLIWINYSGGGYANLIAARLFKALGLESDIPATI